jgi:hypothetical protein
MVEPHHPLQKLPVVVERAKPRPVLPVRPQLPPDPETSRSSDTSRVSRSTSSSGVLAMTTSEKPVKLFLRWFRTVYALK